MALKIDLPRTNEGPRRYLDSNIKVVKALFIPVFGEEGPGLNENPDEDGAIGIDEVGNFVYYFGGEWKTAGGNSGLVRIDLGFTDLAGSITIDYTALSANIREPILEFWNTEEISEGVIKETNINGVQIVKTRTEGIITEIFLDGIFGTGFIRVLPAPILAPPM